MRWPTDVDVWTSGRTRNRRTKSEIRDAVSLQVIQQRLAFGAVRMKRDVHGVAMVQPPAVMNSALAEDGDRKFLAESVREETLNLPGFPDIPTRTTGEPNER